MSENAGNTVGIDTANYLRITENQNAGIQSFACPRQYMQGIGLLDRLPELCSKFGQKPLLIITNSLNDQLSERLCKNSSAEFSPSSVRFHGFCSEEKAKYLESCANDRGADMIVGIGGGNLMDAAKLVSSRMNLPLILFPSSISCDAATSAMSVLYDQNGEYCETVKLQKRADLIISDTELILKSPLRLFVSGIGDALASYFEARAGRDAGALNYVGEGYRPCQIAQIIAKATYDILIRHGRQAVQAFVDGKMTEDLALVIENNILLSGLAFENTSCAVAHGLHSAFDRASKATFYHGERVAFGLLCQLQLEHCPESEFKEILSFCGDVGLPLTLNELCIESKRSEVMHIAQLAVERAVQVQNEPFNVTAEALCDAILAADEEGKSYHLKKT